MKYKVTQIDDPAVRGTALTSLWQRNGLHQGRDPGIKHRWFYQEAPAGPARAFFLVDADAAALEPLGCCGLGTRTFWLDNQAVQAGLFADFAVDQAHRTALPALMLQRALCADAKDRFPLTYGFPNPSAVGIFERIGFPSLGPIGRFVAILDYSSYIARVIRVPGVARLLGGAFGLGIGAWELARTVMRRDGARLSWQPPDAALDELFVVARRSHRFIGDRSAAFLRWRFAGRPEPRADFVTLRDAAGTTLGYAVIVRKEPGVALIADFLARDIPSLRVLFARLLPALRARGFAAATAFFLGAPAITHVLTESGFRQRESTKYVVAGGGKNLPVPPEELTRREHWYLTEADRDN